MANDPLAPYRKTASPSMGGALPPQMAEDYEAFAAKDKVCCLRIRSRAAPINSPRYRMLLNVVYDREGTHFIMVFTTLIVLVRGRNLQNIVFAVENELADFIQEFDARHWQKPKDAAAPFIESIDIKTLDESSADMGTKH